MALKVGSLLVDIQANVAHIRKDFNQIHKEIRTFNYKAKKIFKSLGFAFASIFSVYAIAKWTKSTIQAIDTLEDLAMASGMTMKEFGGLAYAAQSADVSMEKLQVATKTLSAYMLDAEMVGGSYRRYFDAMGITIKDTSGKLRSAYDVMLDISDIFAKMEDGAEKTALATRMMGRSGSMLIPVLNKGREELQALMKEYVKFGAYVAPEVAAKVDLVKENFLKLKSSMQSISWNVMSGLSESLAKITSAFLELRTEGDSFIKIGEKIGWVLEKLMKSAFGLSGAFELLGMNLGAGMAIVWTAIKEGGKGVQEMESLYNEKLDSILLRWTKLIKALETPIKISGTETGVGAGEGGRQDLEQVKNRINEITETYKKAFSAKQLQIAGAEEVKENTKDELEYHKTMINVLEGKANIYREIFNKSNAIKNKTEEEWVSHNKNLEVLSKTRMEIKKHEEGVKDYTKVWANVKDALGTYANEAKNIGKQIEEVVISSIKKMEDTLVEFVTTGKASFKDLVNSIIADLARMAIRQYFTGPLAGALGLQSYHQGGIVGTSGQTRMIPAAAYAGAPRFHSGLRANEVPAILERGEEVIPKEQAGKHLTINVPVTIAERNPLFASSLRESIEDTVRDVIRNFG